MTNREDMHEDIQIANAQNEINVFAIRLRNGLGDRMKHDIEEPPKEFLKAIQRVQRRERIKRFFKKIFHRHLP